MDFVYVAYLADDNKSILNEDESTDLAWLTLDEIKDSSFNTFPDIIEWIELIYNNY